MPTPRQRRRRFQSTALGACIALGLCVGGKASAQESDPPPLPGVLAPPDVPTPTTPTLPETIVEAEIDPQEDTSPGVGDVSPFNLLDGQFNQPTAPSPSMGRAFDLIGETISASEGRFGARDIEYRPFLRPGEVVELVPGLIATQHSGSGKANQFFARGINLDHGTDFALRIDGVPINLPSHGHGQGYLDINWLIPELVEYADYKLGPYYADVGDFSAAGALDIRLRRSMPQGIATITGGSFDYYRALVADSAPLAGGELLFAYESVFYEGPWTTPEDFEKFNGVISWSTGDDDLGMSLSFWGYRGYWNATNQVPRRAVEAGLIDRFGSLDPSDAGDTGRATLNWQYWNHTSSGSTRAGAYAAHYDLDLYSNFTFFLDDQVNGDQIEQIDQRYYSGAYAEHEWLTEFGSHTMGAQFRNDNIYDLQLNHTRRRALLDTVRSDNIDQQSFGLYYANRTQLTEYLQSYTGLRGDFYRLHTFSRVSPLDSGTQTDGVFSPKFGLILGPWADTELFGTWGQSFHSNDARGVNAAADPADPLVKSEGTELGMRSWLTSNWNSSLAVWHLEIDSELLFVGDAGTTEPSNGSRRYGVTWTNFYQLGDWLWLDADYAWVHPRFIGGEFIPNAVENVLSSGFTVRPRPEGFYGTLRLRHYGPAALIEDNSARSDPTSVVNLQVGYETRRMVLAVDIFNLFDSDDNDITYFYESRVAPGFAAAEDFHFHPVEPVSARAHLTLKY